jgi:hypothetical protein
MQWYSHSYEPLEAVFGLLTGFSGFSSYTQLMSTFFISLFNTRTCTQSLHCRCPDAAFRLPTEDVPSLLDPRNVPVSQLQRLTINSLAPPRYLRYTAFTV